LIVIFWQWRPTAICWIGWLTTLASSYMIDHFDMLGLCQVFAALRGAVARVDPFKTPLLYRVVRQPIMLGFLLAFWATPRMTAGHLLFAVMTTGYILLGVRLEERDSSWHEWSAGCVLPSGCGLSSCCVSLDEASHIRSRTRTRASGSRLSSAFT
jgi:hypothetical protein